MFTVELFDPELFAVGLDDFALGGGDLGFGLGLECHGGGLGDNNNGCHFFLAEFGGCGGGGCLGFGGCALLCGSDEVLNQVVLGCRRGLLGFGGAAALFGSGICGSGVGSLGDFLALLLLRLLLCLVLLVVGLSFAAAAAAGVAGCDFGGRASAGGRRFGATALLHFLLEVFVGDGDVVFGCLLVECLSCREAELLDDVCESHALFAAGVGVVEQTARGAHSASSEFRARFLARGAECADFG